MTVLSTSTPAVTPAGLSGEQEVRLMGLLEQYCEQIDGGATPDIAALVAQAPDLEGPLREHLQSLKILDQIGREARAADAAGDDAQDLTDKQLGDYRLLRQIGRGGMGVVYEAHQGSLNRRVALKILPFASMLDQQQIERFKNEARAAAQLSHPHIVPVYSVGCERGVHYYAMQLIDGRSLDLLLRQQRASHDAPHCDTRHAQGSQPTARFTWSSVMTPAQPPVGRRPAEPMEDFRSVAELGIQVALALEAAHQHGIIHRDIKPSNLLVDNRGAVWVTDFGLARVQADAGLTITGDLVGTLRYMSPEQAAGRSALVDERADIYALGITLYELLTGCEAFAGDDRQDVVQRILHQEPPAPRRLRPDIPRDLETIVLKASAKPREQRYASARELADDLQRFLDGRPILARRPTLWDRTRKWAARHKRAVRFALGLAGLALLGLVTATLLIARANFAVSAVNVKLAAALKTAEDSRHLAEENLQRAQAEFRRAREAVDLLGTRYADRLARLPGTEELRRDLLVDTLNYYLAFIHDAQDDSTLQRDLAGAYAKVGSLTSMVGDRHKGLAAYRKAEGLLQQLVTLDPAAETPRADLAQCAGKIALALNTDGQAAAARSACQRAIALQTALVRDFPDQAQHRRDLALSYNNLALIESQSHDAAGAEAHYRQALRLQEEALKANGDDVRSLADVALTYSNLSCLYGRESVDEALRCCRTALDLQQRLVQRSPGVAAYRNDLALIYSNLGTLENHRRRPAEAGAAFGRAIALEEELVQKSPAVNEYRQNLAFSHNNLGQVHSQQRQWKPADAEFARAETLLQDLVRDYPDDAAHRSELGGVLNNRALTQQRLGETEAALHSYRRAIEHQRAALDAAPQVARFRDFLSRQYWNYARLLHTVGRNTEAADAILARRALWPGDGRRLFAVACELGVLAESLSSPGADSASAPLSQRLAAEVAKTLRQALDAGFDAGPEVQREPTLAMLRRHPQFAAIEKHAAADAVDPSVMAAVDSGERGP